MEVADRIGATGGRPLHPDWEMARVAPGTVVDPSRIDAAGPSWLPAHVPGTVASNLVANGLADVSGPTAALLEDLDAQEWWFRTVFDGVHIDATRQRAILTFDGLATYATVWLNGRQLLSTGNMFTPREVDVTARLLDHGNELVIRFEALSHRQPRRAPRPRWRTPLVRDQELRWHRTTLLGRMPGWSPAPAPLGPWRDVRLEVFDIGRLNRSTVTTDVIDGVPTISVQALVETATEERPHAVEFDVEGRKQRVILDGRTRVEASWAVEDAELWWPHTHGLPRTYRVSGTVEFPSADVETSLGRTGFRTVELTGEAFPLLVNGEPVFWRGANWLPFDAVGLAGSQEACRERLQAAVDAGMNMLRIPGCAVYEQDHFYDLCDELGVAVWQDLMFASMDYPSDDNDFSATVQEEVDTQISRLSRHPSIVMVCGNSEVSQQAAMLGLGGDDSAPALFAHELASTVRSRCPTVPYRASSPSGGPLPFRSDEGDAHYYGVGIFGRGIDDALSSGVRFASECLGFANVPEAAVVHELLRHGDAPVSSPAWKRAVPRDLGAGYDFDTSRDLYLRTLFGVDAESLRREDAGRYLELSRLVTAEVMRRTLMSWRADPDRRCSGALVWMFQDLLPGAGWGLLQSNGIPKAAYHGVRRAFSDPAIDLVDRGLNGLAVRVVYDGETPLAAEVEVALERFDGTCAARSTIPVKVAPRSVTQLDVDAMLGAFHDTSFAYRFGPRSYDVARATLHLVPGSQPRDAFFFPTYPPVQDFLRTELAATAQLRDGGDVLVHVEATRFAFGVRVDAPGYVADDAGFHLGAGCRRAVHLSPVGASSPLRATVDALNASGVRRVEGSL